MKKTTLLLSGLFALSFSFAQTAIDDGKITMLELVNHGLSKPLREIATIEAEEDFFGEKIESKDREKRVAQTFAYSVKDGAQFGNDESTVQKTPGNKFLTPPIANWQAQSGGGCPPDPSGAAGPNHYVQSVNATPVKVYSKTGATLLTITNMGNLWSPVVGNMGDPIILYDKYADRFFLSQFGAGNKIYIAISQTNDPTGAYYTYTYTSPDFPDYLKFSVWWDGYYMTANYGEKVFVFERDKMLLGLSARGFSKTYSPPVPSGFFCPMPADADGQLPPIGTPMPIFQYTDNAWGGGVTDAVRIYNFTTNWVPTTPTATVSTPIIIPAASFDSSYDPSWNDIWQPGTTQKLDGIGGILQYRAQWRKWAGYNTVVLSWPVKVNAATGLRSIKWAEVRQDQSTLAWTMYQEGIYAPADGLNRWMSSIAMDDNGSIGLCFAVSGSTTASPSQGATTNVSPSLRYTGRVATDPLGTMSFAEQTAIAGSGSMTGCGNRFGDYAQTSMDPDGVTFWHTGDYITSGTFRTRIYSFQIPAVVGVNEDAINPHFNAWQSGSVVNFKGSNLPTNEEYVVDLFDITGKQLSGKKITPVANSFETTIDVNGLAKGTYLVRIGNTGFQRVVKVMVN
ncbi:MAG: T9SS type A sorting domain-containing protein [Bacteroidota bacterium]|nr:T9SS type A sorting domain-containing protein [Bacteroidota bacterium]